MKRIWALVAILLASSSALMAQTSLKLNYEEFRSWMKQSVVNGYTFVDSELDGGDYSASFMQLNKMIGVRVASGTKFESFKNVKGYDGSEPYDFKGSKTVFVSGSSSSTMYIYSPKLNATFIIATSYCKLDKGAMEKVALDLGLGSKF